MEKRPFFRADTAGLGKYSTGGYGRIGVYRVNLMYYFPMCGFYFFIGSNLEKCGKFRKNGRFFRADTAGLGKYCTGGYGRIGVYRGKYISLMAVTLPQAK